MKEGLKAIIWLIVGLELLLVMFILFSKFLTNEKVNLDLDEEEQEELNNIIMPTFTKSDITDEIYRTIYNVSFIENNDITIEDLSYLEVTYYDLDGNKHIGDMIVNNKVADEVLLIFKELYDKLLDTVVEKLDKGLYDESIKSTVSYFNKEFLIND